MNEWSSSGASHADANASPMAEASPEGAAMDRVARTERTYRKLFGEGGGPMTATDPEFMAILQRLIFGEVFHTGNLDDQTRELITVVVLATTQALPQLKSHAAAALHIGVMPLEIREAVYQCAPFIGFPKTLNAIGVINEVFSAQGIALPLPPQATVNEADRHERGNEIQEPIYGDEIRQALADLPAGLREAMPNFLTEFCFGDFYTRDGLTIRRRELLVLCLLAAFGGAEVQIRAHAAGNLKVGNSKETLISAMIQCSPYIGFPRALNAIRLINELEQ